MRLVVCAPAISRKAGCFLFCSPPDLSGTGLSIQTLYYRALAVWSRESRAPAVEVNKVL